MLQLRNFEQAEKFNPRYAVGRVMQPDETALDRPLLRGKVVTAFTTMFNGPDLHHVHVRSTASQARGEQGGLIGAYAIFRALTECRMVN